MSSSSSIGGGEDWHPGLVYRLTLRFGCQISATKKVGFWWFFGTQISDPNGGFRYPNWGEFFFESNIQNGHLQTGFSSWASRAYLTGTTGNWESRNFVKNISNVYKQFEMCLL